ncbi:zonular occludens toxin domain-containing protein [Magnetofaba australis]|uniref:Putative zona occludens toxin n=1 Tax=Magnetofaba australis IT-1 TaxID=1434232 RepID=A0A1Y2K8F6_9PROT|nr:zonular occludens toxin domain-containing protein [Magnetofaba australis]OSM07021.1 putative zona occludens toxin [Magnetofaba australis IT-1]
MAIKYHHGAPGSFKTSGAIADDLPKAVKAGRLVITNIRGISPLRVRDVFRKVHKIEAPESFHIEVFNDENPEDYEKLRRFYHWAPKGAMFFFDEVYNLWDPDQKEFSELDYPGGREAAERDGREPTLRSAFAKHRHYNWDFIIAAQNMCAGSAET